MARKKAVSSGRKRYMGSPTSSARAAANIKAMSSPGSPEAASPNKRSPRKPPAPRGKWSEEQLMTSDKSPLIDADLVKLLSSSAAWHFLEESEKREVLALLPSDVHPNPEPSADNPSAGIPALPDSFVRYSNNWRDGIRQFQNDLQNGFYDPEWLRQANEARQERAGGAFDSFKEREYEEFWGQKQKLDWRVLTGEAAKVKLGTLVQAGLVQVGDVWKFRHLLGKGDEQQSIEKETRVEEIHGSKLTFVMPAGQRVFLRSGTTDSPAIKPEDQPQNEEKKALEVKNETVSETMVDSCSPPNDKDPDLKMEDPKSETPVAAPQETDPIIIKSEDDEVDTPKQSNDQEDTPVPAGADSPLATNNSGSDERDTAAQPDNQDVDSVLSTPLSSPRSLSPPWSSDEKEDENQRIQANIEVVIRSPSKMPAPQPKRPVPQPASEPERKRKRGRPRKTPLESQSDQEQSDYDFEEEPEPEIISADSPEFRVVLNSVPTLDPTEYRKYEPQSPGKRTNNATDMLSKESSELTKPITPIDAPAAEGSSPANMDVDVDMDMDIIELVPNEPDQQSVPDKMESTSSPESAEVPAVETTDTPVQAEQTPLSSHSESADAPAAGITEAPVQLEPTPLSTSNSEPAELQAMYTKTTVQPEPAPSSPPATQPTTQPTEPTNEPEEVTVHDIVSPNALVQKILSVDGRKTGARIANAWRDLRCYRNNQDMGSLWDIRQAWFLKNET